MQPQIHFVDVFVLIYNTIMSKQIDWSIEDRKTKTNRKCPQFKILTLVTVISDVKGCRQANRNKKSPNKMLCKPND